MGELFTWLSSTPVAGTTLLVLISILIVGLVLIYLLAFFQGREISFWPPKIGEKPSATSKVPLPPLIENRKMAGNLTGIWLAAFQFGKTGEMSWANEEVEIRDSGGGVLKFRSVQNDRGYKWEGDGKIIDNANIYGEIHSVRPGSHSHTIFILAIHRQGHCLYGRWLTSNDVGKIITGLWVLGKQKKDLAIAKNLIE